jgi:diguanylate cyclase (GGDEF)-like protein
MESDQGYILSEQICLIGEATPEIEALNQLLTEQGYEIRMIRPQNAVDLLGSPHPYLIILCSFKNQALCNTLKADKVLSSVPILAFPVDTPTIDKELLFELGCADYLSIPLKTKEAIARVEHQMMLTRLDRQIQGMSEQGQITEKRQKESQWTKTLTQVRESDFFLDTITQVASRQRFQEYLDQQWRQGTRDRVMWADSSQTSISLIFCTLENWVDYQQQHGLELANHYVQEVAKVIVKQVKRPSDLVARYKDDTFAILLPNTNNKGAYQVARILFNAIKAIDQSNIISMGVATEIPTSALPLELIVRHASQAYLKASQAGGDRIINYEDEEENR